MTRTLYEMSTEDGARCRQNRRHLRETRESHNRSTLACNSNLTERADQQGTNQTASPSKQAERAAPSAPGPPGGDVIMCILFTAFCFAVLYPNLKCWRQKIQQTNITFKKGRQHPIPPRPWSWWSSHIHSRTTWHGRIHSQKTLQRHVALQNG